MLQHSILNYINVVVIKDYRLLKLVFTVMALWLIYDTFYSMLVLKPTFASDEKRPISEDDFPEIIVCPEPSIDIHALRLRGYDSVEYYYKGLLFGSPLHQQINLSSWTGNKSEDVKDVIHEVSSFHF